MIKGSVVLKKKKTKQWRSILEAWWASDHPVLIIHCLDHEQAVKARKAAYRFKETLDIGYIHFTCATSENNLYLTKLKAAKYAMEVVQTEEGVLYYYDTSAPV